jgi:hypothetical protein
MQAATPVLPVLFPDALRAKYDYLVTMESEPRYEEKTYT